MASLIILAGKSNATTTKKGKGSSSAKRKAERFPWECQRPPPSHHLVVMASVAMEMTGYCEEVVMALLLKAGWCNANVVGSRVSNSQGLLPSKFLPEDSKLVKRQPG